MSSVFISHGNSTCLPDEGNTEVYRYYPVSKTHTVSTTLQLFQGAKSICTFVMDEVDPEARLLVWIMAAHQIFGESRGQSSQELWDRVPLDFPLRMTTLSSGYDGLHGPFGRGLAKMRENPPTWFHYRPVDNKLLHWLDMPGDWWDVSKPIKLWATPNKVDAKSERDFIVAYLRHLADKIAGEDWNAQATMPVREENRPLRPWYLPGVVEPQGFEYAGPHTIELKIVLPRRIGEQVSDGSE